MRHVICNKFKYFTICLCAAAAAFVSIQASASPGAVTQCSAVAERSKIRSSEIDWLLKHCLRVAQNYAHNKAYKMSPSGRYRVTGANKSLIVEDLTNNQKYLIAGQGTSLDQILAVDINETHQNILVLNEDTKNNSKQILSFPLAQEGHYRPLRQLHSEGLKNATDIAVNPATDEIYVISPSEEKIRVYRREATMRGGSLDRFSQQVLREIALNDLQGASSLTSIAVSAESNSLFLASHKTGNIFVINSLSMRNAVVKEMLSPAQTGSRNPASIQWNNSGKLEIQDEDSRKSSVAYGSRP